MALGPARDKSSMVSKVSSVSSLMPLDARKA